MRLFSGLVPALFTFGGAHYALWVAGEMKNPRRDVPLALVLGVSIVIVVYLLVNWAYLQLLGYDGVVQSISGDRTQHAREDRTNHRAISGMRD